MTPAEKAKLRIDQLESELTQFQEGSFEWNKRKVMIRSHERVIMRVTKLRKNA